MTLSQSDSIPTSPCESSVWQGDGLAPSFKTVASRGAPIVLLGVPLDNVTTHEAIASIERMVQSGRPHYLVTANVDFLVQATEDVELRRILMESHLVLCDGTPLLWASRWLGNPLAERVAGSDLVPILLRHAAQKGQRVFFLGGAEEAAREAVLKLQRREPDLIIAGHYSPPFQHLLEMDHANIVARIRAAKPDLLFVCFGCPKQEKWIAMHYRELGVPVSIGVGGTIDFLAGRLARAPHWMRRTGTEWLFRLGQEPRRLFRRYARDCWHFGRLIAGQWIHTRLGSWNRPERVALGSVVRRTGWIEIGGPEWIDAETVRRHESFWEEILAEDCDCLLDLSKVRFIDSTGLGLLVRLRKRLRAQGHSLVLVAPSPGVTRLLETMQLSLFFRTAADAEAAQASLREEAGQSPVVPDHSRAAAQLSWRGEVTAANAHEVWTTTERYLVSGKLGEGILTLDLSAVTFIDSTGLGLIVRAKKEALKSGARLVLTGVQSSVLNVIRLSRLEKYLLEPSA